MVKLTKRFRQLRVLIEALLTGLAAVGYVAVLILVFNFILGVAGVNYFKYRSLKHTPKIFYSFKSFSLLFLFFLFPMRHLVVAPPARS